MIDRNVTHSKKEPPGEIAALGNPTTTWSPRSKADVIRDIESGSYRYLVRWPEKETVVRVVNGATGKYLRSDRDETTRNNLLDLPNL